MQKWSTKSRVSILVLMKSFKHTCCKGEENPWQDLSWKLASAINHWSTTQHPTILLSICPNESAYPSKFSRWAVSSDGPWLNIILHILHLLLEFLPSSSKSFLLQNWIMLHLSFLFLLVAPSVQVHAVTTLDYIVTNQCPQVITALSMASHKVCWWKMGALFSRHLTISMASYSLMQIGVMQMALRWWGLAFLGPP